MNYNNNNSIDDDVEKVETERESNISVSNCAVHSRLNCNGKCIHNNNNNKFIKALALYITHLLLHSENCKKKKKTEIVDVVDGHLVNVY